MDNLNDECVRRITQPVLSYLEKRNPGSKYFAKSYHDFFDGNSVDSVMIYKRGFLGFRWRVAMIDVMTSKMGTTHRSFKSFCPREISDAQLEEFIVGFDLPKILSTQMEILDDEEDFRQGL